MMLSSSSSMCQGFTLGVNGITTTAKKNHSPNDQNSCTTTWHAPFSSSSSSPVVLRSAVEDDNDDISSSSTATAMEEEDTTSPPPRFVEATPILSSVTDPEAIRLRDELLTLAQETNKGFKSTPSQKKRARDIIEKLAKFNPTQDPAAPYYSTKDTTTTSSATPAVSLTGKWDLIYTDAPDITSLDTSWNPLATAKLGRIGQECTPPLIKNVIEWQRPDWADQLPLPFVGNSDSRILQKVCVKATALPQQPMKVNLELVGIDFVAPPATIVPINDVSEADNANNKNVQDDIAREGLLEGILRNNPLELRGPLTAPFGQFEILYLDEEMRIIRTNQNFLAVNMRSQKEWF